MSWITDEIEAIKAKFAHLIGHEKPEVDKAAKEVTGDLDALKTKVEADVAKLEHDAAAAAAPVAKEAKDDGEEVCAQVAGDVANVAAEATGQADAEAPASPAEAPKTTA